MNIKVYTGGSMPGKVKDWRNSLPELDNVEWLHPAYGDLLDMYFPRDVVYLKACNVMLVHFVPGYNHMGVLTEIGMAYAWNKPIIISVGYKEEHQYTFAMQCATSLVPTLAGAIDIIEFMSKDERYGIE